MEIPTRYDDAKSHDDHIRLVCLLKWYHGYRDAEEACEIVGITLERGLAACAPGNGDGGGLRVTLKAIRRKGVWRMKAWIPGVANC
jgi:hypothetical protein